MSLLPCWRKNCLTISCGLGTVARHLAVAMGQGLSLVSMASWIPLVAPQITLSTLVGLINSSPISCKTRHPTWGVLLLINSIITCLLILSTMPIAIIKYQWDTLYHLLLTCPRVTKCKGSPSMT